MKKVLAILLAGMMTATAFAGCSGGGEASKSGDASKTESGASKTESGASQAAATIDPSWPEEKLFGDETDIVLKVWAPDAAVELTKKQVEAFKSHYANTKFKSIEVVAQGESDAATQIINDPDKAADIFGFPSDQLDKLVAAQVLSSVTKGFASTVEANNAEKPVAAIKQSDGSLLAYPETNDNGYYLVYDGTAITADEAKSLEGTLEACKKAGKQFVMDCGDGFFACTFAFTAGIKIAGLDAEGTQQFEEYNEDEAVATIMAFAQLMKDYKGTFSSQQPANISTGFKNGKVAAGIDGTWNARADKDALGDKLAAAKLPTIKVNGADKDLISMFGYKYIGVNAHTKFPRSAQILAYYLTGEECQSERAKELGWGPSNTAAQAANSDNPILQAIAAQADNALPQVNIAPTFWTAMGTLGSTIYKDDWKPDDAAKTKDLINKVIAQIKDE